MSLIGNEVWGLNRDTQLKATDSLNIHVNSAMLVANGWRQIAFWVPNPHIALLSISNNVIFFSQCSFKLKTLRLNLSMYDILNLSVYCIKTIDSV